MATFSIASNGKSPAPSSSKPAPQSQSQSAVQQKLLQEGLAILASAKPPLFVSSVEDDDDWKLYFQSECNDEARGAAVLKAILATKISDSAAKPASAAAPVPAAKPASAAATPSMEQIIAQVSASVAAQFQAQLDALQRENAALRKATPQRGLRFAVSEKGAMSAYGVHVRFPVTLYKDQWIRLLDAKDEALAFLDAHNGEFKTRES